MMMKFPNLDDLVDFIHAIDSDSDRTEDAFKCSKQIFGISYFSNQEIASIHKKYYRENYWTVSRVHDLGSVYYFSMEGYWLLLAKQELDEILEESISLARKDISEFL